jgi:hypothetical protein
MLSCVLVFVYEAAKVWKNGKWLMGKSELKMVNGKLYESGIIT